MKRSRLIVLVTYLLLLALLPVGYLVGRAESFSAKERRVLTDKVRLNGPAILSGDMMRDTENYLADQIPQRDLLLGIKSGGLKALCMRDNGRVIYGDGYLLDRCAFDEARFERNLAAMESFASKLPDSAPEVWLLAIPRVDTLAPQIRPPLYVDNTEDKIRERLTSLEGITCPDYADYLATLADDVPGFTLERELFYKTDHHWTQHGARYGAELFLQAQDLVPVTPELELRTKTFRGTTFAKSGLLDAPCESIFEIEPEGAPDLNRTLRVEDATGELLQDGIYDFAALESYDPYLFFGDNIPYFKVVNPDALTQRRLVVFKDSFFNSLLPYLTPHYRTIEVVDLRFYKRELNPLVDDLAPDDAILLCYRMLGLDGPLEALGYLR